MTPVGLSSSVSPSKVFKAMFKMRVTGHEARIKG